MAHDLKLYRVHSPLGQLYLGYSKADDKRITRLYFADADELTVKMCQDAQLQNAKPAPAAWQQAFDSYFAGALNALSTLPYTLDIGTAFEQSVWRKLASISPSSSQNYGELARSVGKPKAARAVGSALRKNPLPLILPCHRVLRSDGNIGGYQGTGDLGIMRKRYLLWHEGVLLKP